MVGVSASVNLPLQHKVQKFSSGTGSPGWSQTKGGKTVVGGGGVVVIHSNTATSATGTEKQAQRQQHAFHQESGGGWRKDEVRSWVGISAFCFLRCHFLDHSEQ